MPTLKRYDIKKLLANPDVRRRLIVESTRITQAREDIEVAKDQVENSYYIVTEAERGAFFALSQFRAAEAEADRRHTEFVRALFDPTSDARVDVTLKDLMSLDNSTLSYGLIHLVGAFFREYPRLDPAFADARQGLISTESGRFVRCHWEVRPDSRRKWVPYAKGGDFSRFYSDIFLVFDWTNNGAQIKAIAKERYGSASRTIKCEDYYFREGITWVEKTVKGMNARVLPPGALFNVAGPSAFPHNEADTFYLLGVLNSNLAQAFLNCFASRSWGVEYVGRIPIPAVKTESRRRIEDRAQHGFDVKRAWNEGNEICTTFTKPWILHTDTAGEAHTFGASLDAALSREAEFNDDLVASYEQLNDSVYRLYGVNETLRSRIESAIGNRPSEFLWPEMEGQTVEQKRMEHVSRLLTYAVKCVVEQDDDGLVALQPVAEEAPLLERVRTKLASFFPRQDQHALEIELVNELKRRVKGYARAESLHDWLTDVFFDFHCALYQQRPILWHLASSQESAEPAFSVIVHYHRFDHDRLAKLRSVHVRDRLATLRREAAQASKDGREDDRLQLLAALEEVEAFDRKLARLHEGHHEGIEAGENDYRILTPWKAPQDRPKGWRPDLDDGVKVNIAPLARTGLLRTKNKFGARELEDT
ncbi:MAG: hypothetical protein FJ387_10870 [Verrucomicrobia bacterium]|nr:hypothetical protein [Verrucomicrobiota bacterium]